MTEIYKIERLLKDTQKILTNQREIEKIKGEKFNIFSILRMETRENITHSGFLAELLNPKGSHLKGNVFLQLFVNIIKNTSIDINSPMSR